MWILFAIIVPCLAQADPPADKCFEDTKYITCNPVLGRPAACECTNIDPCYIKMIITRKKNPPKPKGPKFNYLVNGTFQGPTIIAKVQSIVVVDVFNEMAEDTSIHFHGMHQRNVPWIDGVGNLTQYPIPAGGKFRYIFRAFPQGTHWYHSHMRYQRDSGLFGALIVGEARSDIHVRLGQFVDEPQKKTLALLERLENTDSSGRKAGPFCLPDGSDIPVQFDSLSLFMNGKEISENVRQESDSHSEFYVVPGKNYRFRIIAATESTILIVSIDFHKMHVMATDGFLVEKFETDFLVAHVGERYDFILEAKKDVKPGSKFPINIQTLATKCNNNSNVAGQSFAFVVYTSASEKSIPKTIKTQPPGRCTNASSPCKVLNCPFQIIPDDYSNVGAYMDCYNVLSLQLLYPTPPAGIPSSTNVTSQSFFNFVFKGKSDALINGVKFELPDIPLVENKGKKYECKYPVNTCKKCTHAVYLNSYRTTARFVLTSMEGSDQSSLYTHPIHMHGHTYFIAKIAYPEYFPNGTIKAPNKDLSVPSCGPPSWSAGTPQGITVDSTTVRKDVIIVPAGGYVVFHFITDNPGYWFMHCHIDKHLNDGMAIAVGENPTCASTPLDSLFNETSEFCFSVATFLQKELENNAPCHEAQKNTKTPSPGHTTRHNSLFVHMLFLTLALALSHMT